MCDVHAAAPPNSPLHAPLTRVNSPVPAVRRMLSFSETRGAEEMFVAYQQLTSLSPRREIPCNQNMIARGYAAELSVARSTNASKLARSRCKANALFLQNPRSRRDVCCKATTDLSFSAKRDSVQSNKH